MLLIGTYEGLYRAPIDQINDATRVFDSEHVHRVRQFDDEVFAATSAGLFRSTDSGQTWTNLGVPRTEVYSVLWNPNDERLYAGTHPTHLYVSTDDGESWRELEGFRELPSREEWSTPRHRNEAHIRSLCTHPDSPHRIIAGIEVGGIHVSDDDGVMWTERRVTGFDAPHTHDIHHVLVQDSDTYVASTGSGLYRTRDAGRSWTRLDADLDHTYFREAFAADGRLYAAAARSVPSTWGGEHGPDAALFESTDGGDAFETVSYPNEPEDFVFAWTALDTDDGDVLAGTRNGTILQRSGDEWTTIGSVPASISALAVVSATL